MKTRSIRGGLLIIIPLALGAVQPALAQKSTAFDAKDQFTLVSSGLPNILTATITKAKPKRLLLVTALVGTESSPSVRMGIDVNGVNIAEPTNYLTNSCAQPGCTVAGTWTLDMDKAILDGYVAKGGPIIVVLRADGAFSGSPDFDARANLTVQMVKK